MQYSTHTLDSSDNLRFLLLLTIIVVSDVLVFIKHNISGSQKQSAFIYNMNMERFLVRVKNAMLHADFFVVRYDTLQAKHFIY